MQEGKGTMRVSTENTAADITAVDAEDWLDQFPDTMSTEQLAANPAYATHVAAEVIAEAAYGVGSTTMASNVQITAAMLALTVAAEWFGGRVNARLTATDAPSQKMIATAMEMSPVASIGVGKTIALHMDDAAACMYANMDALACRNRFHEASTRLPKGFDFSTFANKLGGAFACAVSTFDVKGVC